MKHYVTKEELEVPRKASDILSWHNSKRKEVGSSKAGRTASRCTIGLLKEFHEEAAPIAIVAESYFEGSELVTIRHVIGSQSYDAEIYDERDGGSDLHYFEVTQANEGEDEHLRMLALDEKGFVNSYGRVTKGGNKHSGRTIDVANEAVDLKERIDQELGQILRAAIKKSNKPYPDKTGLIIYCDDDCSFLDAHLEATEKYFIEEGLPLLEQFSMVFLVGKTTRKILCFNGET